MPNGTHSIKLRSIHDVTEREINALFKKACFKGFTVKIRELIKDKSGAIDRVKVYATFRWDNDREHVDHAAMHVATLYAFGFDDFNCSLFGCLNISHGDYREWVLWCGFKSRINYFELMDTSDKIKKS